jgi:Tfp pilus assembly protein PilN
MAGVNLLTRLTEREIEEGVVGEGAPIGNFGGNIKEAFLNAIADLTAYQKTNFILLIVACILASFQADLVDLAYFESLLKEKHAVNDQLQQEVNQLRSDVQKYGDLKDQIVEYDRKLADLRRKIQEIDAIRKSKRDFAIRLTDYVVSELPEGVWLTGIRVDVKTNRKVELDGKSMDLTLLGVYMQRLEKGAFFPKWNLVNNSADVLPEDNNRDIRRFQIDAGIMEVQ